MVGEHLGADRGALFEDGEGARAAEAELILESHRVALEAFFVRSLILRHENLERMNMRRSPPEVELLHVAGSAPRKSLELVVWSRSRRPVRVALLFLGHSV